MKLNTKQNLSINFYMNKICIYIFIVLIYPSSITAQVEKQVRDQNPGLFKNQRLFHSPPNPFFKNRKHNIDFITDISTDSIISSSLFFKTNFMEHYREFALKSEHGMFRFNYDPKIFPATHLEYYFIMKTKNGLFGSPIDDNGNLSPIKKLLIDPIQYYKQKSRLNQ